MSAMEKWSPMMFLLMWSSGAIFVKLGLEDASVSVFLAIRSAGAAIALFVVCFLMVNRGSIKTMLLLSRPLLLKVVLTGLLLQVVYQSSFFLALNYHMTPGVLAIILGLQPVVTPIVAREKMCKPGFFYLGLGFIGLVIAVFGAREVGAITGVGLLFGLVSVFAISAGSVMQKKTAVNPVVSAFYQTLTAACVFLIILPFTPLKISLTPEFLMSALWMIIVVSTLAVVLFFRLLEKNSASKVGVLFYMVPVVTILLDYLAFGNSISWITVVGAALVFVAVKEFGKTKHVP